MLQPQGLQYALPLSPGQNVSCTSPLTLYWLQPGARSGCAELLEVCFQHAAASHLQADDSRDATA